MRSLAAAWVHLALPQRKHGFVELLGRRLENLRLIAQVLLVVLDDGRECLELLAVHQHLQWHEKAWVTVWAQVAIRHQFVPR